MLYLDDTSASDTISKCAHVVRKRKVTWNAPNMQVVIAFISRTVVEVGNICATNQPMHWRPRKSEKTGVFGQHAVRPRYPACYVSGVLSSDIFSDPESVDSPRDLATRAHLIDRSPSRRRLCHQSTSLTRRCRHILSLQKSTVFAQPEKGQSCC
jgi:hypothetical protein